MYKVNGSQLVGRQKALIAGRLCEFVTVLFLLQAISAIKLQNLIPEFNSLTTDSPVVKLSNSRFWFEKIELVCNLCEVKRENRVF